MSSYIYLSIGGLLLSLGLMILFMPKFIEYLKKKNYNQTVSEYALDEFKNKAKTPIMGGIMFVIIPLIVFIIFNFKSLLDPFVSLPILSYLLFSLVGFWDDITIIIKNNNEGVSPKAKLIAEFIISIVLFFLYKDALAFEIVIPAVNISINLGYFYLLFFMIAMVGEANAANFTDGMDGLCAGVSLIGVIGLIILCLLCEQYNLVILLSCIVGGLIGYLIFNWHPAKIFMGDSGSLALGALFASIGVILNKDITLIIITGVFVWEMLCVCIQQVAVRVFHKRVFKYTPIHYAYKLQGHKETNIVLMFYVLEAIFVVIAIIINL